MMRQPRAHTLRNGGAISYTFTRQGPAGMVMATWAGQTWLARCLMDAPEARAAWRRLRRQGYRPALRD